MAISAIVCTRDSVDTLAGCLSSLVAAGVNDLIVVDAGSVDGSRELAASFGALVLTDAGVGLGAARNVGIAASTGRLVLNMGADNVMPPDQLNVMVAALGGADGVGALTLVDGSGFIACGLNAWRQGRFRPGSVPVIGTPSLFDGDTLRANPFDEARKFSDDSELCERWARDLGARFVISEAFVFESGRSSWRELVARCRMYGVSDSEVFRAGCASGWSCRRRLVSLAHPWRVDVVVPVRNLPVRRWLPAVPFLILFAGLRYFYWVKERLCGQGSFGVMLRSEQFGLWRRPYSPCSVIRW
jgi:glycosyltransferase involved in cell wall biosynthesis